MGNRTGGATRGRNVPVPIAREPQLVLAHRRDGPERMQRQLLVLGSSTLALRRHLCRALRERVPKLPSETLTVCGSNKLVGPTIPYVLNFAAFTTLEQAGLPVNTTFWTGTPVDHTTHLSCASAVSSTLRVFESEQGLCNRTLPWLCLCTNATSNLVPSQRPTHGPSRSPTLPTAAPSRSPTARPTGSPSKTPTAPLNITQLGIDEATATSYAVPLGATFAALGALGAALLIRRKGPEIKRRLSTAQAVAARRFSQAFTLPQFGEDITTPEVSYQIDRRTGEFAYTMNVNDARAREVRAADLESENTNRINIHDI
jgi:hypothetical protein